MIEPSPSMRQDTPPMDAAPVAIDSTSGSGFICSCGYDLTGVTVGSACPECGRLINAALLAAPGSKTHVGAIISLVTGILGITACGLLSPVALVLGLLAKRDARRGGFTSSTAGLAIAGIVLGSIGTVLMLLGALVVGAMLIAGLAGM